MEKDLSGYADSKYELNDFGIFCLTVREAAELIAIDMWISGEVVASPELENDHDVEPSDPRLKVALAQTIELFVRRLLSAIESDALKAEVVRRDFDEQLLPDYTYVRKSVLFDWLSERGYTTDVAFEEWDDIQQTIYMAASDEVETMQAIGKAGLRAIRHFEYARSSLRNDMTPDPDDPKSILRAYEQCFGENARLKIELAKAQKQSPDKVDRPLSSRERDSLLTTIAVLCKAAGFNAERHAKTANLIQDAAAKMGISIGETTIENQLKKIPDALGTRTK